jgi:threonine/homoserine/homoserine lactone efflux protein/enamine deaminase RidA (YjgF/YER057c/UK114 family)
MVESLGALVLFAAVMTLTPGPNVVLVTASGAAFGFRRTIPQMLGITLGFGLMVVAAGFGFAGIVRAEPRLHLVLKYAGAAYLLYLAWRIGRAESRAAARTAAKPIGFVAAWLFTWVNPKAWVAVLGALAAYTTVDGHVLAEVSLIALVLAAFCLLSCVVWTSLGSWIGSRLATRRARLAFNWTMAALLVLSLMPVLRSEAATREYVEHPEVHMSQPHAQTVDYGKVLEAEGITLPPASPPAANYVKAVRVGDLLFLSGHAAVSGFRGKLGSNMTTAEGYEAARSTAVSVLATLQQELGDLNRVKRIVKVMGMVNSAPDYTEQHLVMNGFSDLLVAVFGDIGRHARSAVGMAALPFDFAVEVDVIVEIEPAK